MREGKAELYRCFVSRKWRNYKKERFVNFKIHELIHINQISWKNSSNIKRFKQKIILSKTITIHWGRNDYLSSKDVQTYYIVNIFQMYARVYSCDGSHPYCWRQEPCGNGIKLCTTVCLYVCVACLCVWKSMSLYLLTCLFLAQ